MPCRDTVASGLATGMFFAVMPVPMQMIFAGVVAMRLRSNVPIAMAACWLSNPATNGPLWALQLWLGDEFCDLLGIPTPAMPWLKNLFTWFQEKQWIDISIPDFILHANLGSFVIGSLLSGILFAALAFGLVHLLALVMPHHLPARPNKDHKVSAFMRKIHAQREARKQAKLEARALGKPGGKTTP